MNAFRRIAEDVCFYKKYLSQSIGFQKYQICSRTHDYNVKRSYVGLRVSELHDCQPQQYLQNGNYQKSSAVKETGILIRVYWFTGSPLSDRQYARSHWVTAKSVNLGTASIYNYQANSLNKLKGSEI